MTLHFKAEREVLADAVGMVARVASSKVNIAATAGIRCVVEGDKLTMAATDLETSITTTISVAGLIDGEAVIPAKRLSGAVTALPDGAIDVKVKEHSGPAVLRGGGSSYSLPTYPVGEFPHIGSPSGGMALDGAAFRAALAAVLPAAAPDSGSRPLMAGVHLHEVDGRLVVAATDSYRLHRVALDVEWDGEPATVPALALGLVAKLTSADTVVVSRMDAHVAFTAGDTTVTTTLIAGEYPAYSRLIGDPPLRLGAVRDDLIEAVKRAGVTTGSGSPVVLAISSGRLELSGRDDDGASGTHDVEVTWDGPDLTLGVNPMFFRDALGTVRTPTVSVRLVDALKPLHVVSEPAADTLALMMPMRLK